MRLFLWVLCVVVEFHHKVSPLSCVKKNLFFLKGALEIPRTVCLVSIH